jgi:hypothetical protein
MASMQSVIKDTQECHQICLDTKKYCLEKGGKHADTAHIALLSDCAELCMASEHFMMKGSQFHGQVCGVCADACAKCAESCEQFSDEKQMTACAEVCRRCEESCRSMASM